MKAVIEFLEQVALPLAVMFSAAFLLVVVAVALAKAVAQP